MNEKKHIGVIPERVTELEAILMALDTAEDCVSMRRSRLEDRYITISSSPSEIGARVLLNQIEIEAIKIEDTARTLKKMRASFRNELSVFYSELYSQPDEPTPAEHITQDEPAFRDVPATSSGGAK